LASLKFAITSLAAPVVEDEPVSTTLIAALSVSVRNEGSVTPPWVAP
jgi:hypothetical protein